jgi:AraC-like DNA-binding protein
MLRLAHWTAKETSAAKLPGEGVLRLGACTAIPELLRKLGQDPEPIVASTGVDLRLFDKPDNTIAFVTLGRLLSSCAERTQRPHFGLLVGEYAGAESLGLIGSLVQHSANVGAALRSLILHFHLHDRGAVPTLSVREGVAVFGYAIYQRGAEGIAHVCDGAMAIGFNLMRSLCGAEWTPAEVLFSHSKPADIAPYRRLFGAPLRFDADQTALVFPARWLEHRLSAADSQLRQSLEAQIEALEMEERGDVVAQLRRVLRSALISGDASREHAARLLSMHGRTLNRRLKIRGTTFKALLEEARLEIARQLLEGTRMPVIEIAATLDYTDASAFTRAFNRWTGMPPVQWRTEAANARKTREARQPRR